jgi:hypothetical protein
LGAVHGALHAGGGDRAVGRPDAAHGGSEDNRCMQVDSGRVDNLEGELSGAGGIGDAVTAKAFSECEGVLLPRKLLLCELGRADVAGRAT